MYIALAERFYWTPEQVDRLDPTYLEELIAKLTAVDHHEHEHNKPAKEKPTKS